MNNLEEIIEVITLGLVVAAFLLNTGRALKAIELCKESLVLLNNETSSIKHQLGKLIYAKIYKTMFVAYRFIQDNPNAITYGKKLLVIYCECGESFHEGILSIKLAQIYHSQNIAHKMKRDEAQIWNLAFL